MKKLIIVPILLVCLTGASTRKPETIKSKIQSPILHSPEYAPDIKVDKLDSLLKKL